MILITVGIHLRVCQRDAKISDSMKDEQLEIKELSRMSLVLFQRNFFKAIISKKEEDNLSGCNIIIEKINELIAHLYL